MPKLTNGAIIHDRNVRIREDFARGVKRPVLRNRYGLSRSQINKILQRVQPQPTKKTLARAAAATFNAPAEGAFTFSAFVASDGKISIVKFDHGQLVGQVSGVLEGNESDPAFVSQAIGDPAWLRSKFDSFSMDTDRVYDSDTGARIIIHEGEAFYQLDAGSQKVPLPIELGERLAADVRSNANVKGLINFAMRLQMNPSKRMLESIYGFIKALNIEIDEDGTVLCFKRVTSNYRDIHTGTFDNSPGKVVSMPRNQIDENGASLCSAGLHVCALQYLKNYGSEGDRVVQVKVDPAYFVSVVNEEFSGINAKARVCRYQVIRDVTDEVRQWM